MKIPGKSHSFIPLSWGQLLIFLGIVALYVEAYAETWVGCLFVLGVYTVFLLLICSVITPTHMRSILPWRQVKLAEAELALYYADRQKDATKCMGKLTAAGKVSMLYIHSYPRAERERILALLKSTCKSYTEEQVPTNIFGLPRIKIDKSYLITYCILGGIMGGLSSPSIQRQFFAPSADSAALRETAAFLPLRLANSESEYKKLWNRADEAKNVATKFFQFATAASPVAKGQTLSELEQAEALELAALWYCRAAELGHAHAMVMAVYLAQRGVAKLSANQCRQWGDTALSRLSAEPSPTEQDRAHLYLCYHFGIGTEIDEQKAEEILNAIQKSANE